MENFEYHVPTKIFFGSNQLGNLGEEVSRYSNNILLVYGTGSIRQNGIYERVMEELLSYDIKVTELGGIQANPDIESVRAGKALCRKEAINFVLAVGGGSVIDCAKAIAAAACYDNDPWDFFLRKLRISKALPVGSVLTLSATGSEMNRNAVISNRETGAKLPVNEDVLKPVFSILDPEFSYSVSRYQTAAGTADIMSHCIEQYFSAEANTYIQDRLTESLMKTCIHYGPLAMQEPENYDARANLMWASTLALNGMLSAGKQGDWATHQIEHKISALYDLAHGVGLAIITPHWMEYVLSENSIEKFLAYASNVWGLVVQDDPFATAREGINKTREFFFDKLEIADSLRKENIEADDQLLEKMAEDIVRFGPLGKIKILDKDDVYCILKKCI
jgi:butanol dehydrogenase